MNNIHYVKGILTNRLEYFNKQTYYKYFAKTKIDADKWQPITEIAKKAVKQTLFFEDVSELIGFDLIGEPNNYENLNYYSKGKIATVTD